VVVPWTRRPVQADGRASAADRPRITAMNLCDSGILCSHADTRSFSNLFDMYFDVDCVAYTVPFILASLECGTCQLLSVTGDIWCITSSYSNMRSTVDLWSAIIHNSSRNRLTLGLCDKYCDLTDIMDIPTSLSDIYNIK
jgi:hypothetical protein